MEKCVTLSKWGIQRVNPGAVTSRLDAKIIVAATTTVHIQSRRSVGKEFVTSLVNSATTSFPQPEIRPAGCGFLKRKLVGAGGLNSESEWPGDVSQSQITERKRADASIRGGGSLVRNASGRNRLRTARSHNGRDLLQRGRSEGEQVDILGRTRSFLVPHRKQHRAFEENFIGVLGLADTEKQPFNAKADDEEIERLVSPFRQSEQAGLDGSCEILGGRSCKHFEIRLDDMADAADAGRFGEVFERELLRPPAFAEGFHRDVQSHFVSILEAIRDGLGRIVNPRGGAAGPHRHDAVRKGRTRETHDAQPRIIRARTPSLSVNGHPNFNGILGADAVIGQR